MKESQQKVKAQERKRKELIRGGNEKKLWPGGKKTKKHGEARAADEERGTSVYAESLDG